MKKRSANKRKRIIVGVTGSLASGKTTVSGILAAHLNAKILDADKIARLLIQPFSPVFPKLVACFGEEIISKSEGIDSNKLSELAFADDASVKKLNSITHPYIIALIKKGIRQNRRRNIIVDAPLLFEAGLDKYMDCSIVVKTAPAVRNKRLKKKFGSRYLAVLKRSRFQMPIEKKISLADFIIDNSKTLKETKKQVQMIGRSLRFKE